MTDWNSSHIDPADVRGILDAVRMYRANNPIAAQAVLARLGDRALPAAMLVLIGAMDSIDLRDAMADEAEEES